MSKSTDPAEMVRSALNASFSEMFGEDVHVVSWIAVADVLSPNGSRDLAMLTSDTPPWIIQSMIDYMTEGESIPVIQGDDDDE